MNSQDDINIEELRKQIQLSSKQQIYSTLHHQKNELSQDNSEMKSYLNDLSLALASQNEIYNRSKSVEDLKSSSMSVESTDVYSSENVGSSISGKANQGSDDKSNITNIGKSTFVDTVLASISPVKTSKKRKISSFMITDDTNYNEPNEPIAAFDNAKFYDDDDMNEPETETDGQPLPSNDPTQYQELSTITETQNEEIEPEHEPYEIQRMKTAQLKNVLAPLLNSKDISLTPNSWKTLSKITKDITTELFNTIKNENQTNSNDQFSIERTILFPMIIKYKLLPNKNIHNKITTEELFELGTKYLTLEDLNELEISLFS